MKKRTLGKSQRLVASYAGTSATREHPVRYITLEEVVDETMRLLSGYAPNTTVEILGFTEWVERHLRGNGESQKNFFLKLQPIYSTSKEGNGNKLSRTAYAKSLSERLSQPDGHE